MKGILEDGRRVAVKVLSAGSKQGDREFMSEIASISNIRHENLVKLHGGCIDGSSKLLVYEYMENNSLAHILLGIFLSIFRISCSFIITFTSTLNVCVYETSV